jgi:pimeloyl-ACP methyl ester carboxylesterase
MHLIKKSELVPDEGLILNHISIEDGSGKFLIEGGFERDNAIVVHYYRPQSFSDQSSVIFVLHGAGRNGSEYRDAWVAQSEKYNLLVLTPEYSEKHYPEFWSYNLAGMIQDVNLENETFKINQNQNSWIFGDFDRIFNKVKNSLNLEKEKYNMFGHSAGGQLLHRLAVFYPENKADRILASNSGWYTLPTEDEIFPYRLGNIKSEEEVDFSSNLIVFLGEDDNADETRGDVRHSPEADEQGLHRLARGKYFYELSKETALKQRVEFNWAFKIISGIGHDYRGMSKAAAQYLYGSE